MNSTDLEFSEAYERASGHRAPAKVIPLHKAPPVTERRSYDGASTGYRTENWLAGSAGPNAEVGSAASTLRKRARDLTRNNPHIAKAITTLVSETIGEGITPVSDTGNESLDRRVDALWRDWSDVCESSGQLDWLGAQTVAARGFFESGEALVRRRVRRASDGLPVRLQIELLEADMLDTYADGDILGENGRLASRRVQGVEFGPFGRRQAYWLYSDHPGEAYGTLGVYGSTVSKRIQATEIAHLYDMLRPGQVRGIPWVAPVMIPVRDFDDYRDAERVRKRTESCIAAFVSGQADDSTGQPIGVGPFAVDAHGDTIETWRPGMLAYLLDGQDVTTSTPASVGGYDEYCTAEIRAIAAGLQMTYELLSGDLSKVNFSSIRAGLIIFRRMITALQKRVFVRNFCRPVWSWFVDLAVLEGKLPLGPTYKAKWTPTRFASVDREADAAADAAELGNGTTSRSRIISERGADPSEVFAEILAEITRDEASGIKMPAGPQPVSTPVEG